MLAVMTSLAAASADAPAAAAPAVAAPSVGHRVLARIVEGPIDRFADWMDEVLARRFGLGPEVLLLLRLATLLVLVVGFALAIAPLTRALARRLQKLRQDTAAQVLRQCAPTLRMGTLLLGMYLTVQWADPDRTATGQFVAGMLYVALVIVCVRGAARLLQLVVTAAFTRLTGLSRTLNPEPDEELTAQTSAGMQRLVQKGASGALWLGGLALILGHFGQSVSSVVTALGVTSLAIGLAAQQALANMIAGLVLLIDRPFRVGDRIRLPGLDIGRVEDLGMRSTRLRLADGNILIVPNTDLLSSRLVSYADAGSARGEVRLQVPAATDLNRLTEGLLKAAAATPGVEAEPAPRVLLLTVADKLDVSLVLSIAGEADAAQVEESLRREALRLLQGLTAPAAPARPTSGGVDPGSKGGAGEAAEPAGKGGATSPATQGTVVGAAALLVSNGDDQAQGEGRPSSSGGASRRPRSRR